SHSSLNSSVRTFNNSDEAEVRRSQRAFGSNYRATRPVSPIPITRLIPACPLPLIIRGPPHSLDRWLEPTASFRDGRRGSNSRVWVVRRRAGAGREQRSRTKEKSS